MMPSSTARQLVEELRKERELLDELINLVKDGFLSIDDSGEEQRFCLTLKGQQERKRHAG